MDCKDCPQSFQLVGILRNEKGKRVKRLRLTRTKYLPSLNGKVWKGSTEEDDDIGRENQLIIKRSKIDVKIILRESSEASKYELFQRLNTGGSQLSDQEMRNVIAITVSQQFYEWLAGLARNEDFISCIALSERALTEQYHLELVTRFIVLRRIQHDDFRKIGDLGDFLIDHSIGRRKSRFSTVHSVSCLSSGRMSFVASTQIKNAIREGS